MESGDPRSSLGDNVLVLEGQGIHALSEKLQAEVCTHTSWLQLTGPVC